jgi:ABC-2 type transport system permease protein
MTGVLRAELRRIATTKLWWVVLICIFALSAGYAALPASVALLQSSRASVASSPFADPGLIRSIYNGGNVLSRILAMVVGIATVGSEYRYGTLASSYLATPHRLRMLLGKAAALLIFGVIYGITSVAAGMLVSIPFVLGNGGTFLLNQPETWRSIILGVCSIALWTLIGMGIGILIKNMLLALVVGVLLGFLVEPIVSVVFFLKRWDQLLNLMPSGATNAMLEITSPVLFAGHNPAPWWLAALVLAAWCLLPALAGLLSAARGDVA